MVTVERSNLAQAKESLGTAVEFIRDGRNNLAISAEGLRRRRPSDAEDHCKNLAVFKKGPFHTTKNADCAFVPVCIFGANRLAPPGSIIFGQGKLFLLWDLAFICDL